MKKLNVLVLALLVLTLGFTTSCDDELGVKPAPTVKFTQGNQSVDPGTAVVLTATVEAPGKLDEIRFLKGDVSYGQTMSSGFDSDTAHALTITIPADQVDETFAFEIQAYDKAEKMGRATATVTVSTQPDFVVNEYNGVTLTAQAGTSNESFFDAHTGNKMTWSTADANADLVFMRHEFIKSVPAYSALCSPAYSNLATIAGYNGVNYSTSGKSATKLERKSGMNFAGATAEDINAMTVASNELVKDLAANDVIAFETHDGVKGLALVKSGTAGSSYGNSTLVVDFKVVTANPAAK